MHKHVGHPGTWQQFLKRSDNTRIPIEEARQKYLKEQFYYDRWMATSQPALYGGAAAGGFVFQGQGIDGPISDTQRYKQCGNAVSVPIVQLVAERIKHGQI